jgi:hypothetical protein
MDEAQQALLMDAGTPCRGQIHSCQRGPRRYYKWQRCHAGTRTQRTVDVPAMEALVLAIADRAPFEQRLQDYYTMRGEFTAVAADARVIEAFCNQAGQRLEQAAQAARTARPPQPVTPLHTPAHLYVSIDGAHAPIRDPQRPWQEVRVGALFTTVPDPAEPRLDHREYIVISLKTAVGSSSWQPSRSANPGAAAPRNFTPSLPASTKTAIACTICSTAAVVSALAAASLNPPASKWSPAASSYPARAGFLAPVNTCCTCVAPISPTRRLSIRPLDRCATFTPCNRGKSPP